VFIYGMLRFGLSPKVYAISTIILCLSLALVMMMARYTGRAAELQVSRRRRVRREG
jgi:ABC-type spermidine/putrescine transport system permease subunit II